MKNSPFLEGNDFFKSHELKENGELLLKAIPEMPKEKQKKEISIKSGPKKPTKEVTKFKNETENLFKKLDDIVKDAIMKKGLNSTKFLVDKYTNFKFEFQFCLNDIINYGENEYNSDFDKTRIVINK